MSRIWICANHPCFALISATFKSRASTAFLVPGIGRTPIRIATDVWEQPFRAALHSILCQRSGIELKRAVHQWNRPRNFREEDGTQFYQIAITEDAGQEGPRGADMLKLFQRRKTGASPRNLGAAMKTPETGIR